MKKILTAVALAAAALTATAQVRGFASYDYDNATSGPQYSQHEANIGMAASMGPGFADISFISRWLVTGYTDYTGGFNVGYTMSTQQQGITLKGRAGFGLLGGVQTDKGGWDSSENYSFYSLSAEASMPLNQQVGGFVGYRWRGALNDSGPNQQRVTLGLETPLVNGVVGRVGYAYTYQNGYNWNGLTTEVGYKF
jgi:hypothetical protein